MGDGIGSGVKRGDCDHLTVERCYVVQVPRPERKGAPVEFPEKECWKWDDYGWQRRFFVVCCYRPHHTGGRSPQAGQPVYVSLKLIYVLGKKMVEQYVYLFKTQPNYGGARWWFSCPNCQCRTLKLYLPPFDADMFACRRCHVLTYQSCKDSGKPSTLYFRQAAALLGTSVRELREFCTWAEGNDEDE